MKKIMLVIAILTCLNTEAAMNEANADVIARSSAQKNRDNPIIEGIQFITEHPEAVEDECALFRITKIYMPNNGYCNESLNMEHVRNLSEAIDRFKTEIEGKNFNGFELILIFLNKSKEILNSDEVSARKILDCNSWLINALNTYICFNTDVYKALGYVLNKVFRYFIFEGSVNQEEFYAFIKYELQQNYPSVMYIGREGWPTELECFVYNNGDEFVPVPFKSIFRKAGNYFSMSEETVNRLIAHARY